MDFTKADIYWLIGADCLLSQMWSPVERGAGLMKYLPLCIGMVCGTALLITMLLCKVNPTDVVILAIMALIAITQILED